jgi:hypothetical protein
VCWVEPGGSCAARSVRLEIDLLRGFLQPSPSSNCSGRPIVSENPRIPASRCS